MGVLDRYVLKRFLLNFAVLGFVVLALFVVFDFINGADEFLDAAEARAGASGTFPVVLAWMVVDYYGPILLLLLSFLAGLLAVGAMGFTFTQLGRDGELVGLVASGVSLYRVAAPVLVAGAAINGLTIANRELVIPHFAPQLVRSKTELESSAIKRFPVRYTPDGEGHLLSAARFDAAAGVLERVTILVRSPDGRVTRRIRAARAIWQPEAGSWRLTKGRATRRGAPAGAAAEPVARFATDLSPTVLLARRASVYPRLLEIDVLRRLMTNPAVGAGRAREVRRLVWSRFSLVAVHVLVLAIAAPLFLRPDPMTRPGIAARAGGIAVVAWAGGFVLIELAGAHLNPVAAAWLPVVVYLPLGAWSFQTMRT